MIDFKLDGGEMAGRERQILQRQFSRAVAHTDGTLLGYAPKVVAEKARLSQKVPNVAIHRGDAEHLPNKASCFDLVTCGHALHHFPLAERMLGEIAGIINPSGRIVIFGSVAPEEIEAAILHNRIKLLRDPPAPEVSHGIISSRPV